MMNTNKHNAKVKEYEIVLSWRGKEVYKGGNIEVMKPILKRFSAREKDAEDYVIKLITETLGSGSLPLYDFEEVKHGNA